MTFRDMMSHSSGGRSEKILQIAGAHDALSARIAFASGFRAIWASSLGLSTVAGRRDEDELSWSETLDAAERIADSVPIPILLDGNEGFGSEGIARLMVRHAAQRGVKGVCFEDKIFPKANSFGDRGQLAELPKFVNLLRVCRDCVSRSSFLLLGRTEALVLGASVGEAIDRAECFAEAGVDAVVVHSRAKTVEPIRAFMQQWSGPCPVIVIPTSYPHTSISTFEDLGIAAIIWANQLLRASIGAMNSTASVLLEDLGASRLEAELPTVAQVLNLSNDVGCGVP